MELFTVEILIALASVIFLLFSIFITYESFTLYKKTKQLFPILLSGSFLTITCMHITRIININHVSESLKAVLTITKQAHLNTPFPKPTPNALSNLEAVFLYLSFLIILFALFIEIKKIKQEKPRIKSKLITCKVPEIILSLNTAIYTISFIIGESMFPISTTSIFGISIAILGLLAYNLRKNKIHLYITIVFLLLSLNFFVVLAVTGILAVIYIIPLLIFFGTKTGPTPFFFTLTTFIAGFLIMLAGYIIAIIMMQKLQKQRTKQLS